MSYRDGPFNDLKVPLTWTAAIAVIVAGVIAAGMLLSDRRDTLQTQAYTTGKKVFDAADRPVSTVTAAPARWTGAFGAYISDYLFAVSENRKLKREMAEMGQWRDVAIAQENVNRRLSALLGMKTNPPIPMVTARVVLDARGPYSNTRLADVGVESAVQVGNPVVNERGLVGRIVGVTHGASRILLLTDIASRLPVMVDRTDARAILIGDGGPNPRLVYMRGQNPVKAGDRVMSSGDGGVIPRGLPVGVAAKGLDGQWRVRLYADQAAIDFVRIMQFQDFTSLVKTVELDRPAAPPPPSNESAQPAIVVLAPPKPLPAAPAPAIAASPGTILAPITPDAAAVPAARPAPARAADPTAKSSDGAPVKPKARPKRSKALAAPAATEPSPAKAVDHAASKPGKARTTASSSPAAKRNAASPAKLSDENAAKPKLKAKPKRPAASDAPASTSPAKPSDRGAAKLKPKPKAKPKRPASSTAPGAGD